MDNNDYKPIQQPTLAEHPQCRSAVGRWLKVPTTFFGGTYSHMQAHRFELHKIVRFSPKGLWEWEVKLNSEENGKVAGVYSRAQNLFWVYDPTDEREYPVTQRRTDQWLVGPPLPAQRAGVSVAAANAQARTSFYETPSHLRVASRNQDDFAEEATSASEVSVCAASELSSSSGSDSDVDPTCHANLRDMYDEVCRVSSDEWHSSDEEEVADEELVAWAHAKASGVIFESNRRRLQAIGPEASGEAYENCPDYVDAQSGNTVPGPAPSDDNGQPAFPKGKLINTVNAYFTTDRTRRAVKISVDENSSRVEVFQLLHSPSVQSRAVHHTKLRQLQRQTESLCSTSASGGRNSHLTANPQWTRAKYCSLCAILIMCGLLHVSNVEEFFEDASAAVRRSCAPVGTTFAKLARLKLWEVELWLRNLSFQDRTKQYRPGHRNFDKQFKVRPLIEESNEAIRRHWRPATWVAIDEILHPFRGRWSHVQKIVGKPGKGIGIKFWACAECGSGMLLSFAMYAGSVRRRSTTSAEDATKHIAASVVIGLLTYICSQHTDCISICIFDNYYTSLTLLLVLLKVFGIRSQGTVRAVGRSGRKGFPNAVKQTKEGGNKKKRRGLKKHAVLPSRKVHQLIDSEGDNCRWPADAPVSVTALPWFDSKPVHMLSTFMGSTWCPWVRHSKGSGALKRMVKPIMTVFYTGTMNGVDLFDQKCSVLRINLRARRWTNKVFFFVQIAHVVDAHIMWQSLHPHSKESLKMFARKLCYELNNVLDAPLAKFCYSVDDPTQTIMMCLTPSRRKAILRSRKRQCTLVTD